MKSSWPTPDETLGQRGQRVADHDESPEGSGLSREIPPREKAVRIAAKGPCTDEAVQGESPTENDPEG